VVGSGLYSYGLLSPRLAGSIFEYISQNLVSNGHLALQRKQQRSTNNRFGAVEGREYASVLITPYMEIIFRLDYFLNYLKFPEA
jgi:hypothetical protein